jgi:hypothetical protein
MILATTQLNAQHAEVQTAGTKLRHLQSTMENAESMYKGDHEMELYFDRDRTRNKLTTEFEMAVSHVYETMSLQIYIQYDDWKDYKKTHDKISDLNIVILSTLLIFSILHVVTGIHFEHQLGHATVDGNVSSPAKVITIIVVVVVALGLFVLATVTTFNSNVDTKYSTDAYIMTVIVLILTTVVSIYSVFNSRVVEMKETNGGDRQYAHHAGTGIIYIFLAVGLSVVVCVQGMTQSIHLLGNGTSTDKDSPQIVVIFGATIFVMFVFLLFFVHREGKSLLCAKANQNPIDTSKEPLSVSNDKDKNGKQKIPMKKIQVPVHRVLETFSASTVISGSILYISAFISYMAILMRLGDAKYIGQTILYSYSIMLSFMATLGITIGISSMTMTNTEHTNDQAQVLKGGAKVLKVLETTLFTLVGLELSSMVSVNDDTEASMASLMLVSSLNILIAAPILIPIASVISEGVSSNFQIAYLIPTFATTIAIIAETLSRENRNEVYNHYLKMNGNGSGEEIEVDNKKRPWLRVPDNAMADGHILRHTLASFFLIFIIVLLVSSSVAYLKLRVKNRDTHERAISSKETSPTDKETINSENVTDTSPSQE